MSPIQPLLRLKSLGLRVPVPRGMRTIVSDVSFEIGPGESVGLVGESGSGKSMTARSIIRLLPPGAELSGEITLAGRSVNTMDHEGLRELRAKSVAMIFQDPATHINPVRRIGDFVTESLKRTLGMPKTDAEERAGALLQEVGIRNPERCMRQFPHQLSGGMLQRVMIASALAPQPVLLLADEPTTALDVTTQAEVMAILSELQRSRGLAMLFITHDLELAAATCNRTVVMYAGVVVEQQLSQRLHDDPLHPYTAGLVTSRPGARYTEGRLTTIPGRPLSASQAPPGCVFSTRCPHVEQRCLETRPTLRRLSDSLVACHRAEELQGTLLEPSHDGA